MIAAREAAREISKPPPDFDRAAASIIVADAARTVRRRGNAAETGLRLEDRRNPGEGMGILPTIAIDAAEVSAHADTPTRLREDALQAVVIRTVLTPAECAEIVADLAVNR